MKAQAGIVTLTTLLLLSSILIVFLLSNEDLLHLYSVQAYQYQHYIQQSLTLQIQSYHQKQTLCENLPLNLEKNAHKIEFIDTTDQQGKYAQYIWCYRLSLFKKLPHSALNEQQFERFIQRENIPFFQTTLFTHELKSVQFYWFTSQQNEWTLQEDRNAVVIAEGDLYIKGKGKITGTVITAGKLRLDDTVQVSYRKATVEYWHRQLSHWRLVEKSWHDFKAL